MNAFLPSPFGFFHKCFRSLQVAPLILLMLAGISHKAGAEGSADFVNYPGYRLFLDVEKKPQFKVFAREGEFINVGASHLGYSLLGFNFAGSIKVYRPDGTLHTEFKANNPTTRVAIIDNSTQERNGPTGGGTTNGLGYIPGVVNVATGQEGVWTVTFDYPNYSANQGFPNLLNSQTWTRQVNQPNTNRVVLAWDITVSQNGAGNNGGKLLKGRVYTNEFLSIVSEVDSNSQNSTSPKYYVLSRDGYVYKIDFLNTKPWGFPVTSSSTGLVYGDEQPCYCSEFDTAYVRSANPASWDPRKKYYYEPQAKDYGSIINNKIFVNPPDSTMPKKSLVTDIFRGNTHVTWLYENPQPLDPKIDTVSFTGGNTLFYCSKDSTSVASLSGYLKFTTNTGGNLRLMIDIDNNGSFNDTIDKVIYKNIPPGRDSIFWDGTDGKGRKIVVRDTFRLHYQLDLRGGEIHMMLYDIENNPGQIVFTRLNGKNAPDNTVYYDFTNVEGPVSGGGKPGSPQPTTTTFTYSNVWGNRKMTDYFAYLNIPDITNGYITILIVDSCQVICPLALPKPVIRTNSPACVNDSIRLNVQAPYPGIIDTLKGYFPRYLWVNGKNDTLLFGSVNATIPANSPLAVSPFKVKILLNSDCFSLFSDAAFVTVNQLPTANATNTGPVCSGGMVDLIADNVPAGSYEWRKLNDTTVISTDRVPMLKDLTTTTSYELTVKVVGCAPTAKDTTTITVIPKPVSAASSNSPNICIGSNVQLNGNTLAGATYAWRIQGNPNVFSTLQNPVVNNVTISTTYVLTVKIAACPNDSAVSSTTVSVIQQPVATAAASSGSICKGGSVQLIGNTLPGANYKWTRLGSTTVISTLQSPAINNLDTTTTFVLRVSVPGCTDTATATTTVTVVPRPTAIASASSNNICSGSNVQLFGNTLAGAQYIWTRAGNPTVISQNQNLLISNLDTTTTFLLRVFIPGCNDTAASNTTVVVTAKPTATASASASSICQGSTVQLLGNTVPGGIYEWRVSGKTNVISNLQNPTITGVDTTTTFILTVRVAVCPDSAVAFTTVTVIPKPVATASASSNNICEGSGVQLFGNTLAGASYTWRVLGATVPFSTIQSPVINALTVTTTYVLTVKVAGCPDSASSLVTINVTPRPTATASSSAGNNPVCAGDNVTLTGNTVLNGLYEWTLLGDPTVLSNAPVYVVNNIANTATYVYSVRIPGCPDIARDTVLVRVNPVPDARASAGNNGKLCKPGNINLFGNFLPGATYEWRRFGDTTVFSRLQNPVVQIFTTTTYTLTVVLNGCKSSPALTTVNVSQEPVLQTVTGSGDYCEGDLIRISAIFTLPVSGTYVWRGPNGFVSDTGTFNGPVANLLIPNSNTTHTGRYDLTIMTSDSCEYTYTGIANVVVNKRPVVNAENGNGGIICKGDTVKLFAGFIQGATYEWRIVGKPGIISTLQNPLITGIDTTSLFEVTAIVNGCRSANPDTTRVVVYDKPEVSGLKDATYCEGSNVVLTGISTGGIPGDSLIFVWTGPNNFYFSGIAPFGGPYTVVIPTVKPNQEGPYTLVVQSKNSLGCQSIPISLYLNIEPKPAPPVVSTNSPVCISDTILLSTNYPSADGFIWVNGKGDTIAVNTNNVKLAARDPRAISPFRCLVNVKGCISDFSNAANVTIIQLPVVSAWNNGPVCKNDTVQLFTDTIPNATYVWRVEGNPTVISIRQNPIVPGVGATTTFVVTVRVPGCKDSVTAKTTVFVNLPPEGDSLSGAGTYCEGATVVLSGKGKGGTGNLIYIWTTLPPTSPFISVGPATGPFTLTIPNIRQNQAGVYVLILQDPLTGCQTIVGSQQVIVNPNPAKPVINAVDDTICLNETLRLSCNDYGAGATYQWFRNDTLVATTSTNTLSIPNMAIANRGFYSVRVTVNGCSSPKSDPIFIEVFGQGMPFKLDNPTSADKPACLGSNISLNAMTMAGATYQWYGPNGRIANGTGPSLLLSPVTLSMAGLYYVVVTKNECATVASDTIRIFVEGVPLANADFYNVDYNTPLTGASILNNDVVSGNRNISVTIVVPPKNGTATIVNNALNYQPNQNYIGPDQLIYRICSTVCPDQCDTALVLLQVNGPADCDPIPNIITPNGDGPNDEWKIPCLERYDNSELSIFNRWGDKVFYKKPYKNNWRGTQEDGTPLPAGTYYYLLKIPDLGDKVYTGFITVVR